MIASLQRSRSSIRPPAGFEDYLTRRQAAAELGLPSDFKVRQLEKEGRLHPVRGAMGTAFYPRAEVLGLRARLGLGGGPALSRRRWTDAELIALLRAGKAAGPVRTVADLVVETGISITRAEKVHRFWLRNDTWQAPEAVATVALSPTSPTSPTSASTERRRPDRISHDALIQQMRDPDPRVRAAAFDKLRPARPRHG